MKKVLIIFSIFALLFLVGCGKKEEKKNQIIFNDEESKVQVIFNLKENSNFRLSDNIEDLRTSKEKAILISDSFLIGIEIMNENFEEYTKDHEDEQEFKEETYNTIKGFSNYNDSFKRYEVYLPIENKSQYFLRLTVYSSNKNGKKKEVKEIFESDELKDVLNNIQILIK